MLGMPTCLKFSLFFPTFYLSVAVVPISTHLSEALTESSCISLGLGVLEELPLFTMCTLMRTELSFIFVSVVEVVPLFSDLLLVCRFVPLFSVFSDTLEIILFFLVFWCVVGVVFLHVLPTDMHKVFYFFSTFYSSVAIVPISAHFSEALAELPCNYFSPGMLKELFSFMLCTLMCRVVPLSH